MGKKGILAAVLAAVLLAGGAWGLGYRPLDAPLWLISAVLGLGLLVTAVSGRMAKPAPPLGDALSRPPATGSARGRRTELGRALAACRSALVGTALFSGVLNVLMLTGAFFMLEVYDRVLPSRSVATLLGLAIIAGALFIAQGFLEAIRTRLLVRVGASLSETLGGRVYQAIGRLALRDGAYDQGYSPPRDLDTVRSFLSSLGPTALFDLPWMPLYLVIIFAFHPLLGLTAFLGAAALVILTLTTEFRTREPIRAAHAAAMIREGILDTARRNAESISAMGMGPALQQRWDAVNQEFLGKQQRASDIAGDLGMTAKILRIMLQSTMLGLGAYLVINEEATAGIIIAGSILVSRALAPVDLAIAHWKGFVAARQSWHRLNALLAQLPALERPLSLPPPRQRLSVEGVIAAAPGDTRIIINQVSFALSAGQVLGVIGLSGSGKSSLARVLVNLWQPARGKVRLDGASLDQWHPDELGKHLGYLPQKVELFPGTIAQNVARFSPDATDEAILAAANAAGVHDMILKLPHAPDQPAGYAMKVGGPSGVLSAGQQQRIALARALHGDPFLIVLDEPNSNLDAEGDAALVQAIAGARARGAIVVVIAHRPSILVAVDYVLVMNQGSVQNFGPRDEVMPKHMRGGTQMPPVTVVPEAGRPKK